MQRNILGRASKQRTNFSDQTTSLRLYIIRIKPDQVRYLIKFSSFFKIFPAASNFLQFLRYFIFSEKVSSLYLAAASNSFYQKSPANTPQSILKILHRHYHVKIQSGFIHLGHKKFYLIFHEQSRQFLPRQLVKKLQKKQPDQPDFMQKNQNNTLKLGQH